MSNPRPPAGINNLSTGFAILKLGSPDPKGCVQLCQVVGWGGVAKID